MNGFQRNIFHSISVIGIALGLAGVAVKLKKVQKQMLLCSPMMDDGLAAPIMEYVKTHPGVKVTKELGDQILRDIRNKP